MASAPNHQFHILPPSVWPLITSAAAVMTAVGGVMWMNGAHEDIAKANGGGYVFFAGLALVVLNAALWWIDIIKEAKAGDHTPIVSLHLRYGMILFIASEVMFFLGWFWAYFDFFLFPAHGVWPPKGIQPIDAFGFPLLNTLILLCSGTTVTWAHHALIHGNRDGLKKGLICTVALGLTFSAVQAFEYAHAPFGFADSNFGSAFFMATGFHGFHVLIGTIFLIVCLIRAYKGDFTPRQHFGFEAAAWYWHFVDVVWLFLFLIIYVWGGSAVSVPA
jgi:cytochrome c oxidase subunit III